MEFCYNFGNFVIHAIEQKAYNEFVEFQYHASQVLFFAIDVILVFADWLQQFIFLFIMNSQFLHSMFHFFITFWYDYKLVVCIMLR